MDWKTFIAALIDSLTWPLMIFSALLLLRQPLTQLLPNLKKLKYGDLELEFAGKIRALKAEVDKEILPAMEGLDPTVEFILKFTTMARSDPKATILDASTMVDNVLIEAAIEHKIPAPRVKGIFESVAALRNLEENGFVTREASNLFERLLEIRNLEFGKAATDEDLALDFVYTAARLIAYLRNT